MRALRAGAQPHHPRWNLSSDRHLCLRRPAGGICVLLPDHVSFLASPTRAETEPGRRQEATARAAAGCAPERRALILVEKVLAQTPELQAADAQEPHRNLGVGRVGGARISRQPTSTGHSTTAQQVKRQESRCRASCPLDGNPHAADGRRAVRPKYGQIITEAPHPKSTGKPR